MEESQKKLILIFIPILLAVAGFYLSLHMFNSLNCDYTGCGVIAIAIIVMITSSAFIIGLITSIILFFYWDRKKKGLKYSFWFHSLLFGFIVGLIAGALIFFLLRMPLAGLMVALFSIVLIEKINPYRKKNNARRYPYIGFFIGIMSLIASIGIVFFF